MCLPAPTVHRPPPPARARAADMVGVGLSFACLVHCLALPMLLIAAPAVGAWLPLSDRFHALILLLAVPAAAIALADGWRRHRHSGPVAAAFAGLLLLAAGLAAHEGWIADLDPETGDRLLTSLGALSLASAHIANGRLRHGRRDHAPEF